MNKKVKNINEEIAGKNYDTSNYQGQTQVEKGLAQTHEQVSDDYFEGTVDRISGQEK